MYLRLVLLLLSYRHGAALLSLGLCYALIGLSLVYLELGAHVAAYVHVRYVYGEYFERSACIKALVEHGLGYKVGVFKHVLVALGGAYGGNYALAYTGDDGLLTCAAYQTVYICPDGDAGLGPKLYAVLGYGRYYRGLYDLGVYAHLHGVEHVAAGEVYGAGALEIKRYAGALRGYEGVDYPVHVAACKVVGL